MVEHRSPKPSVVGSSPIWPAILFYGEKYGKRKKGLLSRIVDEYKKVIWPNKSEVIQVTIIVLLITTFVALYVLLFDTIFSTAIRNLSSMVKSFIK